MFALIIVLTFFEHSLPLLPFSPPNMKIGFSNVIIMYIIFFVGKNEALLVIILKSIFIFIIKGYLVFILSITGGIFSFFLMIAMSFIFKKTISYYLVSVISAVGHNITQFVVLSYIQKTNLLNFYLPFVLIYGIISGIIVGLVFCYFLNNSKNMIS